MPWKTRTSHPLDPLSATEIKVAVATVRAAGATPEVCCCFTCYFLLSSDVGWIINDNG